MDTLRFNQSLRTPRPSGSPTRPLTTVAYGIHRVVRIEMTEVYRDWINELDDRAGRARIQVRVDRLAHGNPGKHRVLTGGLCEMKIDVGPGYRVYYIERAGVLSVLLAGGDKSSQDRDLKVAKAFAGNR